MTWPTVQLKDCARIVGGATPKSEIGDYWNGDIPWTTPKDLSDLDGKFLTDTPRKITEQGLRNCSSELLPPNSVLFSSRAPIGHVAINTVPMATNQGFKSMVPGPKLDASFLYWWLKCHRPQLEQLGNGATFKEVSKAVVERIKIPLPPIEEQKQIAAILDQAEDLRRKHQRALDRLNQLGQAIFIEMFGDPKSNPKGWTSARLGDLCDVGSSKRVFVEEFVESGVPFYRGTEVGKLGTGEVISPSLFIAPEHYDELIRHSGKPQIGDLLLPSICHDGRIWRVDSSKPFYFKDGRVLWIKSHRAQIDSEYLRRYLQNRFRYDYPSIASGTTFAELKIINLKNLTVLSPPIELQAEFSRRISAIEALRPPYSRAYLRANALFASLQTRAFRGELTTSSLREAAA